MDLFRPNELLPSSCLASPRLAMASKKLRLGWVVSLFSLLGPGGAVVLDPISLLLNDLSSVYLYLASILCPYHQPVLIPTRRVFQSLFIQVR